MAQMGTILKIQLRSELRKKTVKCLLSTDWRKRDLGYVVKGQVGTILNRAFERRLAGWRELGTWIPWRSSWMKLWSYTHTRTHTGTSHNTNPQTFPSFSDHSLYFSSPPFTEGKLEIQIRLGQDSCTHLQSLHHHLPFQPPVQVPYPFKDL